MPENFEYDDLRKTIQLVIQVNRQEGTGLGLRIAGGKGSTTPFREDDEVCYINLIFYSFKIYLNLCFKQKKKGVFITRILPESPAKQTGLKVGDKLLKVNQIVLNDLTHQQAAETLKNAVKSGTQLTLSVLQELDFNKLFFLQIPPIESSANDASETSLSGFRINHNFNTYQQREVEIIFIADQKRYNQLCKGDILLQINGKNVDAISEKDLNKFVINSNNPKVSNEYHIQSLTIYRPFVEDQIANDSNQDNDDDSSSQQDNEQQDDNNIVNNNNHNSNTNNSHSNENGHMSSNTSNNNSNLANGNSSSHKNGEEVIRNNGNINANSNSTPKPPVNRFTNGDSMQLNGEAINAKGIEFN